MPPFIHLYFRPTFQLFVDFGHIWLCKPTPLSLQNSKVLDFGLSYFLPLKQLNYAKCPSLPSRPVPLTAPPPPTASAGRLRLHRLPAVPAAAAAPRWRPRSGAKNAGRTRRNANDDVTPGGGDRRWEASPLVGIAVEWTGSRCKRWVGGFGDWKFDMDVVVAVALKKTNIKRRVGWKVFEFALVVNKCSLNSKECFGGGQKVLVPFFCRWLSDDGESSNSFLLWMDIQWSFIMPTPFFGLASCANDWQKMKQQNLSH